MKKKLLLITLATLLFSSCKKEESYTAKPQYFGPRQVVIIKTNLGDIQAELFNDLTPNTVNNFIALAEGKKEFTDPRTNTKSTRPYYDGVIFHRVIDNFMIQTGDPTGTGQGGPGYTFDDEITTNNKNNRGTLSMANRGKNTNGAQFFINLVDNIHLNRGHTVFGKVIKGIEVVDKIAKTPTSNNLPKTKIIIETIRLKK